MIRYLVLIENKFGTVSKLLVEEALKRGNITASKAIFNVWQKAKEGQYEKLVKINERTINENK
jgi:hypothetical protein